MALKRLGTLLAVANQQELRDLPSMLLVEGPGLQRLQSLEPARLGHTERVQGFERLDQLTRTVENERQPLADFSAP